MLLNCGVGKTHESPLDSKEINQSILKETSPEYLLAGTDAEAETPILWPPDVKNWLIWKDTDAGKDWRWEEKGKTEDEMVGWHHWLDDMSLSKLKLTLVLVMHREAWHATVHGVTKSQTWLRHWTELKILLEKTINSILYNNKYRHLKKSWFEMII